MGINFLELIRDLNIFLAKKDFPAPAVAEIIYLFPADRLLINSS